VITAFSAEISRDDMLTAPPYTDSCPRCIFSPVVLEPVVLIELDKGVEAIYRHRTCGYEWMCSWAFWRGDRT
jgi:hypothetical protein